MSAFDPNTETSRGAAEIMAALGFASEQLLSQPGAWIARADTALHPVGLALGASRVYVFEHADDLFARYTTHCDIGIDAALPADLASMFPVLVGHQPPGFVTQLRAGHCVTVAGTCAAPCGSASTSGASFGLLLAPIFVENRWWGCLGCVRRLDRGAWSAADQAALRTVAAVLSGAIRDANVQSALRASEERNLQIARATNDVFWECDLATYKLVWSGAIETVFGYSVSEFKGGAWWDERVHPDDRGRVIGGIDAVLKGNGEVWSDEYRFRCGDHSYATVIDRAYVLRDQNGTAVRIIGSMMDITARKALEEQLTYQASHDALTQLPNRPLFMDRLTTALARAIRQRKAVAVLFLDLDRFKVINDSLGHAAGDQLLFAVARRIASCLREEDTAARLGGDEFTVLLEHIIDSHDAVLVAERIHMTLQEPFQLDGHDIFITSSIGIAISAAPTDTAASLLRDADVAMYRAKTNGKACYEIFDPSMNARALERLQLEAELRQALQRGELEVYYQPKVSLDTGTLAGMEALVRWIHPRRGLVSPTEFIPLAEETGLILPLERWVLHEACQQGARWQAQYPDAPPCVISVNLSGSRFRHRCLAADVMATLNETGFPANQLVLEITESVVMDDAQANVTTLRQLKELGVRLAIDDFGTGYSSLSYLKRFPVDLVKIDRSFVARLGQDAEDTAIVQAVATLAHALNLQVVAEGIETTAQLEMLRASGCEFGQGYIVAKPLPPALAAAFIRPGSLIPTEPALAAPVGRDSNGW